MTSCQRSLHNCTNPYQILWEDLAKILPTSCRRSLHDRAQILKREDLVEILVKSVLRDSCMILYRSLSEDAVEILERSSLRGPCIKILQMPCVRGARTKALLGCSWEVLVSRFCETPASRRGPFTRFCWIFSAVLALTSWPRSFDTSPCEKLLKTLVKSSKRSLYDLVQG